MINYRNKAVKREKIKKLTCSLFTSSIPLALSINSKKHQKFILIRACQINIWSNFSLLFFSIGSLIPFFAKRR